MRIGTKITVISCIAAVMAAISMALVTIIVFMSFVRTIQEDETATGINVLAAEVEGDIDEMGDVAELFVASSDGQTSNTDYDSFWAANKPNANSYAAYINGGAVAWSSEGFPLGESAVERITNGEIKGIMADSDKLYTVYGLKVENGALVVCIDLNGSEYVDSVKAKTGAELTLFCGDTRYNTTLINSSGERNIGTQMDGGIWQQVQGNNIYISENGYRRYELLCQLYADGRLQRRGGRCLFCRLYHSRGGRRADKVYTGFAGSAYYCMQRYSGAVVQSNEEAGA